MFSITYEWDLNNKKDEVYLEELILAVEGYKEE